MATQYTHGAFDSIGSTTSSVSLVKRSGIVTPKGICVVVHAKMGPVFSIKRGLSINNPHFMSATIVLRSFYVRVQQVQGEFVATSDVSDVYELGDTSTQAVLNYLYSLVDELSWFQEHKESLSHSMHKDFERLQLYLGLV